MEEKYRNILHAGRKGWGRGLPTREPNLFPPVPVCLSFMAPVIVSKCSEDAFHFIVHIHTPNSHTLLP